MLVYIHLSLVFTAFEEDDQRGLRQERLAERFPLRILRGWTMGSFQVHLFQGTFQVGWKIAR